jgi:hypothetical protein
MKVVILPIFFVALLISILGCSDEKRGVGMMDDLSFTFIKWADKDNKQVDEVEAEEIELIKPYVEVFLRIDQDGTATHLAIRIKERSLLGLRIEVSETSGEVIVPFDNSYGDFHPNTIRVVELRGKHRVSDYKRSRVTKVGGLLK